MSRQSKFFLAVIGIIVVIGVVFHLLKPVETSGDKISAKEKTTQKTRLNLSSKKMINPTPPGSTILKTENHPQTVERKSNAEPPALTATDSEYGEPATAVIGDDDDFSESNYSKKQNELNRFPDVDVDELKTLFPDNMAIPPTNGSEAEAKKRAREERNKAFGKISAGRASPEEVNGYYDLQIRLAEDSIEILDYVLAEYNGNMSERDRVKHEFVRKQFYKRLERIPAKRQEALLRNSSGTMNSN